MSKVENVEVAGLSEEFLKTADEYRYVLNIDLEELKNENFDEVFSVNEVHESNNFVDFRAYNKIDMTAVLPNGADKSSVQAFCDDIASRAAELTAGFEVEWVNGNEVGRWYDEDGDQDNLDDPYSDACSYWANLQDHVNEIDYTNVYDLDFHDNRSFVKEAVLEELKGQEITKDSILSALYEIYEDDSTTFCYVNYDEAAERIIEELNEEVED